MTRSVRAVPSLELSLALTTLRTNEIEELLGISEERRERDPIQRLRNELVFFQLRQGWICAAWEIERERMSISNDRRLSQRQLSSTY